MNEESLCDEGFPFGFSRIGAASFVTCGAQS